MKKNASCKGIRTNLLNNSNAYRPLSKKPIHLDLLSTKGQSPSTFPSTQKYSSPPQQNRLLSMLFAKKYFQARSICCLRIKISTKTVTYLLWGLAVL